MKTLTKILSVTALVVLCVCLFTLTAFAVEVTPVASTATCTSGGYKAHYEDVVGTWYSDPEGTAVISDHSTWTEGARGHDLQEHPATAAKCGVPGNNLYYTCSRCPIVLKADKSTETTVAAETISALTHKYPTDPSKIISEVPASCSSPGVAEHAYCDNGCGTLLGKNGSPIDPASLIIPVDESLHQWEEVPSMSKEPTNVSPGWTFYRCKINPNHTKEDFIPAKGIDDGEKIYYVIPTRDTWLRGEEALTFESNLVKKLNDESGSSANYVGVRIGTDSLYENSFGTFDFWSWDQYVKLGDKTMASLREGTYRLWIYDVRNPDQYTCSCTFYVVDVPTLEAYSTDKHVVNSSKSLRFVASEEIDPNSVMVGSKKLYDSNDFFVSNDRKNITLSADFLNNRQTGTYTISAVTKGGRTIKTNFYILTTAQASSSPRTGDESQIGLWAAFLLLSGAAVVVLVPKLRKQGVK